MISDLNHSDSGFDSAARFHAVLETLAARPEVQRVLTCGCTAETAILAALRIGASRNPSGARIEAQGTHPNSADPTARPFDFVVFGHSEPLCRVSSSILRGARLVAIADPTIVRRDLFESVIADDNFRVLESDGSKRFSFAVLARNDFLAREDQAKATALLPEPAPLTQSSTDQFERTVTEAIGAASDPGNRRKFISDAVQWMRLGGRIDSFWPRMDEWRETAGRASGHYFHQDLLVAQHIFRANPLRHLDIGSRINGFVAHVASFRTVEVMDIRPLPNPIENVKFVQNDLMRPNPDYFGYADSISSLHAIEHFGLGRYGDRVDPQGHCRGFNTLVQMLEPRGTLYISFPVGRRRVEFNAHRVFDPIDIFSWPCADALELLDFQYVGDDGHLHGDCSPEELSERQLHHGCGIYVFRRR